MIILIICILVIAFMITIIFNKSNSIIQHGGLMKPFLVSNNIGTCFTLSSLMSIANSNRYCKALEQYSEPAALNELRKDPKTAAEFVNAHWIRNPFGNLEIPVEKEELSTPFILYSKSLFKDKKVFLAQEKISGKVLYIEFIDVKTYKGILPENKISLNQLQSLWLPKDVVKPEYPFAEWEKASEPTDAIYLYSIAVNSPVGLLYNSRFEAEKEFYSIKRQIIDSINYYDYTGLNIAGIPEDFEPLPFDTLDEKYEYKSTYTPQMPEDVRKGIINGKRIVYVLPDAFIAALNMPDEDTLILDIPRMCRICVERVFEFGTAFKHSLHAEGVYINLMTELINVVCALCSIPPNDTSVDTLTKHLNIVSSDTRTIQPWVASYNILLRMVPLETDIRFMEKGFPEFTTDDAYFITSYKRITPGSHKYERLFTTLIKDIDHENMYWVPTDCICYTPPYVENKISYGAHATYYDIQTGAYVNNNERGYYSFKKFLDNMKDNIRNVPYIIHYQKFEIKDLSISSFKYFDVIPNKSVNHKLLMQNVDNFNNEMKPFLIQQLESQLKTLPEHSHFRERYERNLGQMKTEIPYALSPLSYLYGVKSHKVKEDLYTT